MLPKLENKTQMGTIVYIVLLIINCSTYVYNIYIYSVQQNQANTSWMLRANRARAGPPLGMVQNTYRTRTVQYQRIYVCILFWKTMRNWSMIVILLPICVLLKQILTHNRSKFVLSKLVLTGVCCKHFMYINVCTVHVHFLVCTWIVCLPTLSSDFYLMSKIPTIFF